MYSVDRFCDFDRDNSLSCFWPITFFIVSFTKTRNKYVMWSVKNTFKLNLYVVTFKNHKAFDNIDFESEEVT